MIDRLLFAAGNGCVVLAAAWIVTACVRNRSADLRHRVWLAGLACTALLLIPLRLPPSAQIAVSYTFTVNAVTNAPEAGVFRPILLWVWIGGVCILGLRLASGMARLLWVTRRSRRTEEPEVRVSESIATPMTWGVFRPVILLPEYAAEWTAAGRAYALKHERIHIARMDWLWQTFAQTVRTIFWFHPLVWLAEARLRDEAEVAVDDAMLADGVEPAGYAEQLLAVARKMRGTSPAGAVAMVRRPALTERIAAILDLTRIRTRTEVRTRVAIAMIAAATVPFLGAFQAPSAQPFPKPVIVIPQPVPAVPAEPPRKPVLLAQAPAQPPVPPQEPYRIGGGVSAPVAIYKVEPQYSAEAEAAKFQGEVWLSVVIDERGIPNNIQVTRPLGLGLDEQAILAVSQWRFKPGMKDGNPVPVKATIAVSFHWR